MKNLKKLVSILLAAVLFVSAFSGCGKTEEENNMPEFVYLPTYQKMELPEEAQWLGSVLYSGEKIYFVVDASEEIEKIDEESGETFTEYKSFQKIFKADINGKNAEEIASFGMNNSYTEEMEQGEYIQRLIETENGIAVFTVRSTTTYDIPENFNPETQSKWEYAKYVSEFIMYNMDDSGNFDEGKVVFVMDDSGTEDFYPNEFVFGGNENWYISSWNEIRVYDKDFSELYKIETPEGNNGIVRLKDGRIGVTAWGESGIELFIIDDAKKALGESIALPENVYSFREGGGVYDLVYESGNGGGIGAFNVETGEGETILNWLDSDIDRNYVYSDRVFIVDEETIIAIEEIWNDEGTEYNLINLKKTPSSEIPERKIITLAAVYMDYDLRQDIIEFNKTNTEYRIRPTDYSEYASGDDYNGLTKLNTEIISGNVPDIFITNNMPMSRYAGKGIFEDLTPYIERDIGFENLMEPFFNALRTEDGKLYEIYSEFSIYSYAGLKNVVGDGSSWTFDDLKEAYAKLPEGATVFEDYMNKMNAFNLLVGNNIGSFVNWETGECNFTSEEFIDILEFTEIFPLEEPILDDNYYMYYTNPMIKVAKGEQLLANVYAYNLDDLRASTFYILGDQTALVGKPSTEGSGNTFNAYGGFAMSASCEHKDVVWNFISKILTEEYQTKDYYSGIPTNKKVFDKLVEDSMTPEFDEFFDPSLYAQGNINTSAGIMVDDVVVEGDIAIETPMIPVPDNGTQPEENTFTLPDYVKGQVNEQGWHESPKTWGWLENGSSYYEYPVYAMTEAEFEIIMQLINSTDKINRYDESIMKIITEEVEYFFNGERTAEQTAEYIQSRVKLYVNEQR